MYQQKQQGGRVSMKVMGLLLITLAGLGIVYFFLKKYEKFEDGVSVTFYYMDGCGWCEKFKPEWEKFKKLVPSSVAVKEVEAQKMSEDQQKKIRGFPTIVLSKNGKDVDYEGDRTATDLLAKVSALASA